MNLSENLKKIRKGHNLSQEEFAEKIGVSRQSVSKWESGGAYPEMDKMVQICNLFNLNIDDLLNQDIGEVNNTKQAKNSVNKFLDDMLNHLTKTMDMFNSMNLESKIKCIFEQCLVITIISFLLFIIKQVVEAIINPIFSFLPSRFYYPMSNILNSVYGIVCFIVGAIIALHLFKTRYLDYYEKSDEDNGTNVKDDDKLDTPKIEKKYPENKKEKIIIRDPEHSEYKFINSLVKLFVFFVKCFAFMFGLIFCGSMITFVIVTVLSFLFVKTGIMFFGVLLVLISAILVNYVILKILYDFIFTHKSKKIRLAVLFLISLVLCGTGIGFISIGATEFSVASYEDPGVYTTRETTIKMTDELIIIHNSNVKFIASDDVDVKIITYTTKYNELKYEAVNNNVYSYIYSYDASDTFDILRWMIKNINNKKIVLLEDCKIEVYSKEANLEKIKNNFSNYLATLQYNYPT